MSRQVPGEGHKARKRFGQHFLVDDNVVGRIIALAAACSRPDETLGRCLTLLETISRRAAYLALLDAGIEDLMAAARSALTGTTDNATGNAAGSHTA